MKKHRSDINSEQWKIIRPYFPRAKKLGRSRKYHLKNILDAIFYILKSGCSWQLLPRDFPPSGIVYHYFKVWKKTGLLNKIQKKLHEKVRIKAGRNPRPSAAIIDSQSVKSTDIAGDSGNDGGKKIKGIKRHIVVDVLGLIIETSVTSASTQNRTEAKNVFVKMKKSMGRWWLYRSIWRLGKKIL